MKNSLGGLPLGAEHDKRAPFNEKDEELLCEFCKNVAVYRHNKWETTPINSPIQIDRYYCREHFLELYTDFIMDCGNNVSEEEFMREENIELL